MQYADFHRLDPGGGYLQIDRAVGNLIDMYNTQVGRSLFALAFCTDLHFKFYNQGTMECA